MAKPAWTIKPIKNKIKILDWLMCVPADIVEHNPELWEEIDLCCHRYLNWRFGDENWKWVNP